MGSRKCRGASDWELSMGRGSPLSCSGVSKALNTFVISHTTWNFTGGAQRTSTNYCGLISRCWLQSERPLKCCWKISSLQENICGMETRIQTGGYTLAQLLWRQTESATVHLGEKIEWHHNDIRGERELWWNSKTGGKNIITGSGEIVKPLINSTQLAVTYRAMPKLLEKRPWRSSNKHYAFYPSREVSDN